MSVLAGSDVARFIEGVSESQVQVNGVDLTVEKIFTFKGSGAVLKDSVSIPEYVEVSSDEKGRYFLDKGAYIVQVREKISIPLDTVGICFPRSSLIRMGVYVGSALWDSGYSGFSKVLLKVENPIVIEKGARFAQLVLVRCEKKALEGYKGRYQNE
ncbi:MAG: deoxyuridine 5'-triphosphate nucleotidohydrolase [Nitrososphaeria archaeon]